MKFLLRKILFRNFNFIILLKYVETMIMNIVVYEIIIRWNFVGILPIIGKNRKVWDSGYLKILYLWCTFQKFIENEASETSKLMQILSAD